MKLHWRKLMFPCKQLLMASWLGAERSSPLLPLDLFWFEPVQVVSKLSESLQTHVSFSLVVSGRWFFLDVIDHLWLSVFPFLVLHRYLSPDGRCLMKTTHLGQTVLKSLILCTLFSLGLWIFYCKWKLFGKWLKGALICGCYRSSQQSFYCCVPLVEH